MDLLEALGTIEDKRVERCKKHELQDILLLCLLAVLCGQNDVEGIVMFGQTRIQELKHYIPLKNGIPSADTILRVLARLDSKQFEAAFLSWTKDYFKETSVKNPMAHPCIAIDGKTVRKSNTEAAGKGIHLVSAWASELGIVLGQIKTKEKSNEITAIPELLIAMDLKGIIVTIDAMGCQKEIVKLIKEKKSDYLISLKGNQQTIHKDVADFFEHTATKQNTYKVQYFTAGIEKDHGRIEKREYSLCTDLSWLEQRTDWTGLKGVGMVKSTRIIQGTETVENRYFITSLTDVKQAACANRSHWGIENRLHWVLDMVYDEDYRRNRKDNSAANLAILRKITLNLLRLVDVSARFGKISLTKKRYLADHDDAFLLAVLQHL